MQTDTCAFIPGKKVVENRPLDRFLPLLPEGIVSTWLQEYLPKGSSVLDPLGSTPWLALEAARSGYRVFVASNNPILTLLLEVLASAPTDKEIQAAFTELVTSRRMDERLEVHLQNLYISECASCGKSLQPEGYLWRKGEEKPYGKIYHCPDCGDEGERPCTINDEKRLILPGKMELHRARALERISEADSPLRVGALEVLEIIPPRSLYALSTILNRIEGLMISESRRKILWVLALTALDAGNMLWNWPEQRVRPRALSIANQFRENNLWLALEEAISKWPKLVDKIPFSQWPVMPPEDGGICLFPGRLSAWLPLPKAIQPLAAVGVVPRPNQAFWSLSAVWSGWIWGREKVQPLQAALERRRYDWQWHAGALHYILKSLKKNTPENFPVFLICPELVPGFATAIKIAASAAGYRTLGQAIRGDEEMGQLILQGEHKDVVGSPDSPESTGLKGIMEIIQLRNEPVSYLLAHCGALDSLSRVGGLPYRIDEIPWDTLTKTQNLMNRIFNKSGNLVRSGSQAQTVESGWWRLIQEPFKDILPLSDRVEQEIVRLLIRQPGIKMDELDAILCRSMPGWLTPDRAWIESCLESYAEKDQSGGWILRDADLPAARNHDLARAAEQLKLLSVKLGYKIQGTNPWDWYDGGNQIRYRFYGMASSIISRYVLPAVGEDELVKVLVLPGSRSRLLLQKIQRNAWLQENLEGCHFVKFRHLNSLAARSEMNREIFLELLDTDPLNFGTQQERML